MTAISYPLPPGAHGAHRRVAAPRPVDAPRSTGPRPGAASFRRRRAAVALSAAVLLGGVAALGLPGVVPLTTSGPAPAAPFVPVARATHVVQPGDTLWRIARSLQPSGDVRPLVQRLAAQRAGAPLRAGERLELPAR